MLVKEAPGLFMTWSNITYDTAYRTAITLVKAHFEPTKDVTNLTLIGELLVVYCESFRENSPYHDKTETYLTKVI